jgi:hypothetical protein
VKPGDVMRVDIERIAVWDVRIARDYVR